MMIDAHNHPYWFGMTADKMVADMDARGIDKTWLLSCETPESEFNLKEIGDIKHFSFDTRNMPLRIALNMRRSIPTDLFSVTHPTRDSHTPLTV